MLLKNGDRKPDDITLSADDRRLVAHWAADCAERVLDLFEPKAPADTRPRAAIGGAWTFAVDGKRTAHLRALALAAHAAARAAGVAAATAYTHPLATPHQSKHVLRAAVYQALAQKLAAANEPGVGNEEIRWAIERASSRVREVVRQFPEPSPGRSRLAALYYQLDVGLRTIRPRQC